LFYRFPHCKALELSVRLMSDEGLDLSSLDPGGSLQALVSEPTLEVTRACAGQVCGHVAHCGTWVGTGRMDVSKRGSS
jgi:hypothetical protein